jgi:hypothetical protein
MQSMYRSIMSIHNFIRNRTAPHANGCDPLLRKIPESLRKLQLLVVGIDDVFSKPVVRDLFLLELLVEPVEHDAEQEAADDCRAEHGERDGVAATVAVGWQAPDVGAGNVADLAERVDHGDGDGAFGGWAWEGGADPGVEDDEPGGCVSDAYFA